jgi:FkbM family methyltransferase
MINISEHSIDEGMFNPDGINFIDLGACLGEFSTHLVNACKVKKGILIEANPTNFLKIPDLKNCTKENKFVSPLRDLKEIKFFEDRGSPYNGSAFITSKFAGELVEHLIPVISLNDIISRFNGEIIDLLKVDIECGEFDLILMSNAEDFQKIRQVTIEFHDFLDPNLKSVTDGCVQKLLSFGFELVSSRSADFMFGSFYYDSLFVRKQ